MTTTYYMLCAGINGYYLMQYKTGNILKANNRCLREHKVPLHIACNLEALVQDVVYAFGEELNRTVGKGERFRVCYTALDKLAAICLPCNDSEILDLIINCHDYIIDCIREMLP